MASFLPPARLCATLGGIWGKSVLAVNVAPGIYQLRAMWARTTVLANGHDVLMVDAGGRGSLAMIRPALMEFDCCLADVHLIVLSHYHPDHSGGAAELVGATSAKVAAHCAEAAIIAGDEPFPPPMKGRLMAGVTRPARHLVQGKPVAVDYSLVDGEVLPWREKVQVVHTPGHTPGSICLHIPGSKLLVAGDALQHKLGRLYLPAPGVTWDRRQARDSIEKLKSLDFETICFSHFPPLRHDAKKAVEELLARSRKRVDGKEVA